MSATMTHVLRTQTRNNILAASSPWWDSHMYGPIRLISTNRTAAICLPGALALARSRMRRCRRAPQAARDRETLTKRARLHSMFVMCIQLDACSAHALHHGLACGAPVLLRPAARHAGAGGSAACFCRAVLRRLCSSQLVRGMRASSGALHGIQLLQRGHLSQLRAQERQLGGHHASRGRVRQLQPRRLEWSSSTGHI